MSVVVFVVVGLRLRYDRVDLQRKRRFEEENWGFDRDGIRRMKDA